MPKVQVRKWRSWDLVSPFPEPELITYYATLTTPNMGFLLCPNTAHPYLAPPPLSRAPIFTMCMDFAASTGCIGLCHSPSGDWQEALSVFSITN